MSEATTRATIKAILESVSNVGVVHDYERWAGTIPDVTTAFVTTISGAKLVRGWTITCQSWTPRWVAYDEDEEADGGLVDRTYVYKIRGYFGLKDADATEKTVFALVEAVCDALDADKTLHDEEAFEGQTPPATLTVFEPRMFGGVLCHYAEITLEVTE